MYKCKHFKIQELVSPYWYERFGEACWKFLDPMALRALDILKENLSPHDPVTVNSWMWGDMNYTQSGLRDVKHYKTYTKYHDSMSGHKFGCAFDIKFKNVTTDQVLEWIKENWKEQAGFKIQIEDIEFTRGKFQDWFHIQTRDNMSDELIYIFKP